MNDTCSGEKMARTSSVAVQHGKCGLRRLSRVGRLPRVGEPYWILKDKQDLDCEKTKQRRKGIQAEGIACAKGQKQSTAFYDCRDVLREM